MILLLMLSMQAAAYEELFQANSPKQLRDYHFKNDHELWLNEKCKLDKRREALLWSCFLSARTEMTANEMISDCHLKVKSIQNIEHIPSDIYMRKLPKDCQEVLIRQRQVLAYKAKGI